MYRLLHLIIFGGMHCKDTIPKIRNKYSQKRGLRTNFHIHASVSDLYILTIRLPILPNLMLCLKIANNLRSKIYTCN